MADLTANTERLYIDSGFTRDIPVAASKHIYCGMIVNINATGYAKAASDSKDEKVAGIAVSEADNSFGADGDIIVKVAIGTKTWIPNAALTIANNLAKVYAVDSNTLATSATNVGACGRVVDVDAGTKVLVDFSVPELV